MSDIANPASSEQIVADVIDQGKISAQQMLVVALCLFFNMLDGFDITAMAVVASAVATELNLTPDKVGWILSTPLAGMMAGAMILAPVSDIIGRRKLIIISICLVGASIVVTANATSLAEFILLRFISGMGAGAMLASQATLAAEYSPEKYRALSVAVVTSGYPMGAMMTSVVADFIMPEYGWRGMFWFGGVFTLSMAFVAWALIPESLKFLFLRRPENALARVNGILGKMKKPILAEMPVVTTENKTKDSNVVQVVAKLLSPEHCTTTLTLWAAFFLCISTLYFLMGWIPALIEATGYSASVGRDAFFRFNLGGVMGVYMMGWMSTRWKLSTLIFVLSFSSAIGMVVFAYAPNNLPLLMTLILIIGILQQGGFTGFYAAASKVYPTEIRSTGIGYAIGLGRLGAVAGPAIAGYLIVAGFDMSANFIFFAVPMAVGGFIAWRLQVR